MKIQNEADSVIRAYVVCRDQLDILSEKHGYIVNVQIMDDCYIWRFADRSLIKLDKNGNIV